MGDQVVTVEREIGARAADIFAVIADASRHHEIDGSGTVVGPRPGRSTTLRLHSTFGMSMKLGVPYSMANEVVEFDQDRRIAWRTTGPGLLRRVIGGRVWRYELEPLNGGRSTRVTESWDISGDKQRFMLQRGPAPKQAAESMTKTLERL
ncbi:MAG TPA: SRPBCC family protein, partial [Acidimicrobiales bacterium]|nr:SRPBCC family protein [Acidimicrobiales bacterium]